jgi:hypothetical protein
MKFKVLPLRLKGGMGIGRGTLYNKLPFSLIEILPLLFREKWN